MHEMIARLRKTLDDTATALAADGPLQKRYA
jgi:hypothetical protein